MSKLTGGSGPRLSGMVGWVLHLAGSCTWLGVAGVEEVAMRATVAPIVENPAVGVLVVTLAFLSRSFRSCRPGHSDAHSLHVPLRPLAFRMREENSLLGLHNPDLLHLCSTSFAAACTTLIANLVMTPYLNMQVNAHPKANTPAWQQTCTSHISMPL